MADDERSGRPDRRNDVVDLLKADGAAMTITDLARRLDLHPNTVRFHLEKLVAARRVELAPADRRRPGRPPQRYRAVPGMSPAGPRRYRLLAEVLIHALAGSPDAAARAESAGRAWGSRLAAEDAGDGDIIDRLLGLLSDLGFAPEPPRVADPAVVLLTHCPFLELVGIGPGLVCQVHLGLMRGALAAWFSGTTVARLAPFVTPDRCAAELSPTVAAA